MKSLEKFKLHEMVHEIERDALSETVIEVKHMNEIGPKLPCRPTCRPYCDKPPVDKRKFIIDNITVTRPPLLKIYFWEYFDIEGLNAKLGTGESFEHSLQLPVSQINSKPLKIVFWLLNISSEHFEFNLRRIKNCNCLPMETRVGFNQFRHLYHCPHRRLIYIAQERFRIKPNDMVAISMTANFLLFGEHKLSYELRCTKDYSFLLHFHVDIIGFDSQKCILTKQLIPIDVKEHRRFVQPIWVQNITMQHLNFAYTSRDRGLKLINPNLTVPRLSVWPLMVEYRPTEFINNLELLLTFESIQNKFIIEAEGVLDSNIPDLNVPITDHECADFLYVIYPNKIDFNIELNEERSQMVAIHNHNQKCVEFRWQNYVINDLFEITFDPEIFRLKPHHSKLITMYIHSHDRPIYFKRVPIVLEVHRIFDKSTKIAKELLTEIESIDDPKWKEESYMEHLFLQLNIRINFKKLDEPKITDIDPEIDITQEPFTPESRRSLFEIFYWDHLWPNSNFGRENKNPRIPDDFNYNDVVGLPTQEREPDDLDVDKNEILHILSQLIGEGVDDLSRNWRFIPSEWAERLA